VPLLARAADVFVTHGGANALTPQWRREFSEYLAAVPPCVGSSEFWFLDFLRSDSRGCSEERAWPPPRRARVVAARGQPWGVDVLLRVDAHHQPPLPAWDGVGVGVGSAVAFRAKRARPFPVRSRCSPSRPC
jgi:hypothetical protein